MNGTNTRATRIFSFFAIVGTAFIAPSMLGCGKVDPKQVTRVSDSQAVDFNTLETARAQGISNAKLNLSLYFAANPRFDSTFSQIVHVDPTQSNDCPQGDGWTDATIMKVEGKNVEKYKLKCSTVSLSNGCKMDFDFAKLPYNSQEGHCQPRGVVPFPIPVLSAAK